MKPITLAFTLAFTRSEHVFSIEWNSSNGMEEKTDWASTSLLLCIFCTLSWRIYEHCFAKHLQWAENIFYKVKVHSHMPKAEAKTKIFLDVWISSLVSFACSLIFFLFAFAFTQCERALMFQSAEVWSDWYPGNKPERFSRSMMICTCKPTADSSTWDPDRIHDI